MIAELRWPGDPFPDPASTSAAWSSPPVSSRWSTSCAVPTSWTIWPRWNAGSVLGEGTRRQVAASSALAVILVPGGSLIDYARGGSAAEAVWITAQQRGLAVQPMSPDFSMRTASDDLDRVSTAFGDELSALQKDFGQLVGIGSEDAVALVLRFAVSEPATVRSLRDFGRVNLR